MNWGNNKSVSCLVKCFLLFYLFTFLPFNLAAEDGIRTGCRRGINLSKKMPHRSLVQKQSEAASKYGSDQRQLVVLAAFQDRTFVGDETATVEQWDKIFNQENFTEKPFAGSVHDYFYAQSYGQFRLTFDLQYVALADPHTKYRSTSADDENSQYLVDDIVDSLLKRDIDWSPYDWDDDGYIDQLVIVFAGKGSSYGGFGGGTDAIWPHQYWLSIHVDESGQARSYRTVSSGGQEYRVDCYCALQELASDNSYGSFGTLIHEYSHCFGFPDFYASSGSVIKSWDLMDYGNYNDSGFRPCGYSAHERWLMGWLTPIECTKDTVVSDMPALCDEPQAYLLRNDAYENEYYILENRQQCGWDASLPGSGIVVFHIDYDKEIWEGFTDWPNSSSLKRYTIIPANNKTSMMQSALSGWPYPFESNNELTNTSTPAATLIHPNSDGTLLMNKPITDITITDGLASFEVMKEPTAVTERMVTTTPKVLYDLGPVCIIRCANGEIKKMMKH